MKHIIKVLVLIFSSSIFAQQIIDLPHQIPPTVQWEGGEKEYFSDIWQTQVVTNVSTPTMEVFAPEKPNGTSVIVAPGGGLYALSIESEGNLVAQWLAERGITAFVLKYRLVPTGADGVQEITQEGATNPMQIMQRVAPVLPFSVQDGLNAIDHVRSNAEKYGLDPNKIGFMGFSAGGAVTLGVAYNYNEKNRPDFLVPVYPWTTAQPVQEVPQDAPPMLVICATDDPLGLAAGSIELYSSWLKANKTVGLHMYSKGGHGFGMKQQNLPSDDWIQRFYDWWEVEINSGDIKQSN
ncbi:alpha/beta hydrolase [Maribacter aurantiacus]|uniref:Alpha/beta hydrolase n=1 Tax=Maribacter aurantiacus TaxID=1882343 RepID=A0A5R8M856_9FLAO|nr:alpha/beta hydrolase [Maribacter aurantiacus]TLF45751.1 alpha/beta hydrolase [Maribacter aurantiacus]